MGEPKMPTPEEMARMQEMQKKRILSDASLVEGGADVTFDGKILPTEDQIKDAKIEMGEHFYNKSKSLERTVKGQKDTINEYTEKLHTTVDKMKVEEVVNGTKYTIKWHPYENEYILSFPDLEIDTDNGVYETGFSISPNKEDVKKVQQIVNEVAANETDLAKVYKESLKRFQEGV